MFERGAVSEVAEAHAIDADLAGDREAISAYCDRLEEIRSAYVINHRSIRGSNAGLRIDSGRGSVPLLTRVMRPP